MLPVLSQTGGRQVADSIAWDLRVPHGSLTAARIDVAGVDGDGRLKRITVFFVARWEVSGGRALGQGLRQLVVAIEERLAHFDEGQVGDHHAGEREEEAAGE